MRDSFIGVNENEFDKVYKHYFPEGVAEDKDYETQIKHEIKYMAELLKKLYIKILSGEYNYNMYQDWLKFIKSNYNMDDKNIPLPSYDAIKNKLT